MTNDSVTPVENEADAPVSINFWSSSEAATQTDPTPDQADPTPIPRAFEHLGAPLRLTDRSRAHLVTLPLQGMTQAAQEIRVAIDAGVPIRSVVFDVELDPEEEWDELVAKLNVDLGPQEALQRWEDIERRLFQARTHLPPGDRQKMEEGFALYVVWTPDI